MVTMKELKYAIMAATVLGFSACTNEDDLAGGSYAADPDAVVISASIGAPLTRANTEGDGDQFSENDIIYVENTGMGKITGKEKGYYRLQSDGSTWTPCNEDGSDNPTQYIVWGNDGSNDFRGVYPATAAESFTLPVNQKSLELLRSADYMIGAPKTGTDATTKPADKKLSLTFTHRLAKVTVALVFNDQYTGNETINGLNFYLTDGATSISAYGHEVTEGSETKKAYTAILNPGSYTAGNNFCTINVNGADLAVKVPTGGITLTEGKAHTLTLYVGKNEIKFGNITVNNWGTTQPLDDNVADEETDGPNAATHTITTSTVGQINSNPAWIATAISEGTSLKITGPMDDTDVKAIADYLKANNEPIISLDLSEAEITSIAEQAFYGAKVENTSIDYRAKSLGEVTLPKELTEIGRMAFSNCPAFTIANWDELTSLTTIGGSAFMNSGLKGDIILPESITTIGTLAFSEAAITSIVFPTGITNIWQQMFYRCYSLTKVVFKGDVKSLEGSVFGACSALEEIDFSACTNVPTYTSNPFADLLDSEAEKITLKVKAELVESFKADANWNKCKVTAAE